MAISKIASAGVATDTLTAADLAPDSVGASEIAASAVGISELDNAATGVDSTHHKVPTYANDSARDSAISSPTNGMIIYNTASNALQQYNGAWSAITPAPNIDSISGFINEDNDSTLTIFGSSFNSASAVKMFDASAGGNQVGSNATTTFNSATKLTAVFGGAGVPVAGNTVYIEVDNLGMSKRFPTAFTVSQDPVIALSGNTGTGADTTDHLGTYGGLTEGGADSSNTVLLLNFDRGGGRDNEDSSNIGGDGHRMKLDGGVYLKASPFGDGKTAMRFTAANNQKINVAYGTDNADFSFGSGDFCIDYWIYYTAHSNSSPILCIGAPESASDTGLTIADFSSDPWLKIELNDGAGGGAQYFQPLSGESSHILAIKTWYHHAITKTGTTMRFYLDGILMSTCVGSTITGKGNISGGAIPASVTAVTANQAVTWGGGSSDFNGEIDGYLDELRIVKGETIFPAHNFTPSQYRYGHASATHEAATASNVKLLIHSNLSATSSTFTDSSPSGHTVTVTTGNPGVIHSTLYNHAESTVVAPAMAWPGNGKTFGSTGAYFDGSGDWIYVEGGSTYFNFGSGNFTIDYWAMRTQTGNAQFHFGWGGSDGNEDIAVRFDTDGVTRVYFRDTTSLKTFTPGFTVTDSNWHHYAYVRTGNTIGFAKDGVFGSTTATAQGAILYDGSPDFSIGRFGEYAGAYFQGYIDAFRISKGIARWTTTFNPPTTIYGATGSATVPTITLTGTTTPALASDEDIEYTDIANTTKAANNQKLSDSGINLTLTNLTGGDKSKATLTGTIASASGTTHSNMIVKAQVRKTLGNAAYANASRTVTFSSSTTTAGLAPAMPVTGTGIPASTTITSVDSSTTITLSANPTGGTLTGQSLVFEDLTRITHVNGSDTLNNADAMMTIATGTGSEQTLFNGRRYFGSGTARSITGFGFAPDLVWVKDRDTDQHWRMVDSVRGTKKHLISNVANAESDQTQMVTSLDSDGFSLGTGNINAADKAHIAYGWKAGGAPSGNGKRRTDGSTTETTLSASGSPGSNSTLYGTGFQYVKQSVNTAGQFSITQYQAPAITSGTAITIPHGLSGAPKFILIKATSTGNNWHVWHSNVTTPATGYLVLDLPDAETNSVNPFGNTAPSATHVTLGISGNVNYNSRHYIMYAWKDVAGVSAFGSYEGQGGANTITYTGSNTFSARWVLIKNIDLSDSWVVHDIFRDMSYRIYFNELDAESADAGTQLYYPTITSTGFSFPSTVVHNKWNASGKTYIYAAFA